MKPSFNHSLLKKLIVRVGITGHRPGGLNASDPDELKNKIRKVLAEIKSIAIDIHKGGSAPVLRMISPLAEGSDRIVAREALNLGYELHCSLPFQREEYEKDFATVESREKFRSLLGQATAVFELDGSRTAPGDSYRAVGQMVLNQCDILMAVWNGGIAGGKGSTGQIVQLAALQKIPVVWIKSEKPHSISLLDNNSGEVLEEWDAIKQKLTQLLRACQGDGSYDTKVL